MGDNAELYVGRWLKRMRCTPTSANGQEEYLQRSKEYVEKALALNLICRTHFCGWEIPSPVMKI